jgi:hypothetical protein
VDEMPFCPPTPNKTTKKKPTQFFFFLVVLQCCWESDSVLNVIVKAANFLSCCVCTSHLLLNTTRLKSTSFKLGSLKAISLLSIEPELLLCSMQIKVKLFYFFLKDLEETNLYEGISEQARWKN